MAAEQANISQGRSISGIWIIPLLALALGAYMVVHTWMTEGPEIEIAFKNASGLPNSAQSTTARDMATLGVALREHFPQYYDYFSTRSFTYGKKRMGNHNRLLGHVKGMDGIKTGYTRASGFNLVSSVERDGRSSSLRLRRQVLQQDAPHIGAT